jgi:hypothetical protein
VRFSTFTEITSRRYRPQHMVVTAEGGRTEVIIHHWTVSAPNLQLFTPTHLETQPLTLPQEPAAPR